MWSIVGKFIHYFRDFTVDHSENWLAPTPPIFVLRSSVMTRVAVGPDLDPVNRKAFRRVDVTINGKNAAAMVGIVSRTIAGKPDASTKRWAQNWNRILSHGDLKIFKRSVARIAGTRWR